MKPYRGEIHDWSFTKKPSGIHIIGFPIGHPEFVNWIITSAVIKHTRLGPCKIAVETRNSRYDLVGEGELP